MRQTTALLVLNALLLAAQPLHAAEPAAKPNVVFILCDDLGYGDVACNNPEGKIPTPHIDRLAAEGMRFTDAHTTSSVCTPTRYGVLTGRYNWRSRLQNGVLGGLSPRLIEPGRLTVAEQLQIQPDDTAVGYRVALGDEQWLIYRSLSEPRNRTLLGHNLSTEMLVARFDTDGEVEPLIEIE